MITYKKSGVNIDAGNELVERIKKMAPKIGGFADGIPVPSSVKNPLLIGCADGVGTKLAIAQALNIHNTIGYDLVGMNVNDLVCSGARPLFFLDYFATGKLDVRQAEQVVKGIANACKESLCHLIGGETAEMPGFYKPGEYDLAGFAAGVVDQRKKLDPKTTIKTGDLLLGFPSSGLHSNGYSLVRKVIPRKEWRRKSAVLLKPTKLYVKDALKLLDKLNKGRKKNVKGFVHVTGGGFIDNIPRVLAPNRRAQILMGSWPILPIFKEIQKRSKLTDKQMFRTFNMGIGLIAVISPDALRQAKRLVPKSYVIGEITRGNRDVTFV